MGKFRAAAAGRELMSEEDYMWWLREVMAGRDPDAPRNPDGSLKLEPGGVHTPISERARMKAAEMFGNRCYGQVPQAIVIEEHLRISGKVEHVELAPRRIAQMEPVAKAELRRLLGVALRGDLVPAHNASPTLELPAEVAAARDANPAPED